MRKGFGKALTRFDAYQLAKYKASRKAISLVDMVNIYHPKSTPALAALVNGTLSPANTWENKLTQAGQNAETEEEKKELKGSAWKKLIAENSLGQMALLKNLRNIMEQCDDRTFQLALSQLVDRERIKKAMILPFRYLTAYTQFKNMGGGKKVREVMQALSTATDIACSCCPEMPGETLVVLDTSGSMCGGYRLHHSGDVNQPIVIGSLFASVLMKANSADYMEFDTSARYVNYDISDSVLSISQRIIGGADGGGTNFRNIFTRANKPYDRIIILSDMQGWMGYNSPKTEFKEYKRKYKCDPSIYSFDLQGYGTMQFPERKVFCVAGFSEKIFDTFKLLEQDKNALVNKIKDIEFRKF
jgi:hypothetical protein